jgi:hypothetical protein
MSLPHLASPHLKISENVVFRDLAGEAVLLNLATGTYFVRE